MADLELQGSNTQKMAAFGPKTSWVLTVFPIWWVSGEFPFRDTFDHGFLAFGWLELLESESSNFFWDVDANFVVNIFLNIVTMKCSSIHFKYVVQMLPWNAQHVTYFIIATIVAYTNCHDKTSNVEFGIIETIVGLVTFSNGKFPFPKNSQNVFQPQKLPFRPKEICS